MTQEFDLIWHRIVEHAGEQFQTNNGTTFRYEIVDDGIRPVDSDQIVPRADIERYYRIGAEADTGTLSTLTGGPSFVWSILSDRRIAALDRD